MSEPLESLIATTHAMLTWPENWNTYKALPLDPIAVTKAEAWITEVYQRDPALTDGVNIVSDAEGGVVFEWFGKVLDKHLTIYITSEDITYLLDWGVDMSTQMEDDAVKDIEHFAQLKRSLYE